MVSEMEKAGWFVAGIFGEDSLDGADDMAWALPDGLIAFTGYTWEGQAGLPEGQGQPK